MRQLCEVCGGEIRIQIFKNRGICSGNCQKRQELSDPPVTVKANKKRRR